jgi:hypothetical protein
MFVTPVLRAGDRLRIHGFGLVGAIPLEQGEYKRLVRGASSIGSAPVGLEGAPKGSSWLEGFGSRLTDGLATSRAKTFGGTVILPDMILASSSASSLYRRDTWLSSMT